MKPSTFNKLLEANFPGRVNHPQKLEDDMLLDAFFEKAKGAGFRLFEVPANVRLFQYDDTWGKDEDNDLLEFLMFRTENGKVYQFRKITCIYMSDMLRAVNGGMDKETEGKIYDAWERREDCGSILLIPPPGWEGTTYQSIIFDP